MRCSKIIFAFLPALAILAGIAPHAQASVTDGNLDDWGITISGDGHLIYDSAYGDGYHSSTAPIYGWLGTTGKVNIANGRGVSFHMEDTCDTINSYQVGPLYGGQNYDAEFLGVAIENGVLHIAISSGQRQDNGLGNFGPGDIRVDCGATTYGIEVGGAFPSNATLITEGQSGATFNLNLSSGVTQTVNELTSRPTGSVWQTDDLTTDWRKGISAAPNPVETQLLGGTYVGDADFCYNFGTGELGQHAFIELAIDLSLFGGADVTSVGWGPSCGNDKLYLDVELNPPPANLPEPASVLIWGLLGLGLVASSRVHRWRCR